VRERLDQRIERPRGVGRQQDHKQTRSAQAVPVLDVARQSLAGDVADPAAGLLYADDQRESPVRSA
jgi:hypothetical protein